MAHGHLLFPQALQAFVVDLDARGNGGTRRVVPEDVTHVVQQARGRQQATTLSRLTARSTSGALHGSRPGAYPMRVSTLGANKPESRKRNTTRGAITLEDFRRWPEAS